MLEPEALSAQHFVDEVIPVAEGELE